MPASQISLVETDPVEAFDEAQGRMIVNTFSLVALVEADVTEDTLTNMGAMLESLSRDHAALVALQRVRNP